MLWREITSLEVTRSHEAGMVLTCFEILLAIYSSIVGSFGMVKFDSDPISWGKTGNFSNISYCSEPLTEKDLASRVKSDCFSLFLFMICPSMLRLHEVWILLCHFLLKISERVFALCILLFFNDVLWNLSQIVKALNQLTWLVIYNMNIETSHSSIVLKCLVSVTHLDYKSSSYILELECNILCRRAKAFF
jgi:hypothetical protein